MNRFRTLSFLSVVAIALLALPTTAVAQEAVTLQWDFKPGQVVRYDQAVETEVSIRMGEGMPVQPINRTEQTNRLRMEVLEKTDDGTAVVEITHEAIAFELEQFMTGMVLSFDSNSEDDAHKLDDPMYVPQTAMLGESFKAWIRPDGTVQKVEGMDAILEKALDRMGGGQGDPMVEAQIEQLRTALTNDAVRAELEQTYGILPTKAVATGDEWKTERGLPIPGLGTVTLRGTHTLDELNADEARISGTSTMEKQEEFQEGPQGSEMRVLEGQFDGNFTMDRQAGILHESKSSGDIVLEMMQPGAPQAMPVTVSTSAELTVVDGDDDDDDDDDGEDF